MSETTKEQLLRRRETMQAEQADLRQRLPVLRGRLTDLAELRRQALRRFDLGHDDAQQEAEQALDESIGLEATIARLDHQLAEYPARMEGINKEIIASGHRARLRELLALRADEQLLYNEFEQAAQAFFEAMNAFNRARSLRRTLARSLHNDAITHGFATVTEGDFSAPGRHEFDLWLSDAPQQVAARIERDFAKGRAQIKGI